MLCLPGSLPLPLSWASVPALDLVAGEVAPMVSAGPRGHGGTTNGSDIIQSMRTANKAYAPMTHQFLEWAKENWKEVIISILWPSIWEFMVERKIRCFFKTIYLQFRTRVLNLLIPDMLIVLCHGFVLRCQQHAPPSCNNQMSPDIAKFLKGETAPVENHWFRTLKHLWH